MTHKRIVIIILVGFVLVGCARKLNDQAELIVAITRNQPSRVEELLASPEVNINAVNGEIGPVLCIAAYIGSDEIVEILLKNGANVNIRDDRSSTPLMNAVVGQKESTAKLLLERGADPFMVMLNEKGEPTSTTALGIAQMRNNAKLIELLEKAQH